LYHATKWGIEGFIEAVAQEVAPFGISFTIAEPGPAKTEFKTGLVSASALDVYDNTPSGDIRRALASGAFGLVGDPVKMVDVMIASVDQNPAPKRLAMGSGAFRNIRGALEERLATLDAQKEIAFSTDAVE
jgi:NAD(P)-dependent dehydrogenase (short-subunit alcohol dehydrogenase family)